jgi:hypothetical protein
MRTVSGKRIIVCLAAALAALPAAAQARGKPVAVRGSEASPEIRLGPANRVPACATPDRLMAFLKSRNAGLDLQRYGDIAKHYKHFGEAWRVRWDYAVFQMAVETNSLSFRRGNGDPGDVKPKQNNFAGIGTTGGGVPGDSFPDVKTGVLGHIEHLVAYSGERLAAPVAPRTQLKQGDIVEASLRLNRPVRFADLARRWAVDPRYWQSIETLAESFRASYCTGPDPVEAAAPQAKPVPKPQLARRPDPAPDRAAQAKPASDKPATPMRTVWREGEAAPSRPAAAAPAPAAAAAEPRPSPAAIRAPSPPAGAQGCSVATASYGGSKTLLIRSEAAGAIKLTALTVLEGFEDTMAASFIRTHAPGGASLGAYPSRDAALAKAREMCAGGA